MSKVMFAFLMLALVVAAPAAELVIAVSTEPPGLDPTTNSAGVIKLLLHHNLYENLVQVDETGDLHGQIASAWEISPDGLVYTFHLREGIRFHDGTPCDADAVRQSFLRTMDPQTGHPHREYFAGVDAIESPDGRTVRFQLRAPDASFLTVLALGDSVIVPPSLFSVEWSKFEGDLGSLPVGAHPAPVPDSLRMEFERQGFPLSADATISRTEEKEWWITDKDKTYKIRRDDATLNIYVPPGREDLAGNPVGTGPFRFEEWRPGYSLRLVRWSDYYLPALPVLEALTFRFITDPAAQLAALRAGDVDLVAEVVPEIAATLTQDPQLRVVSQPQDLVQILATNTARAPFSDLRVRQALAHAVDREQLISLVYYGFASPVGSHLAPSVPYYADMTWVYPYDPATARDLLAAAGYPHGFSATLTLPGNYPQHVRTGELLAAQLGEVGIRLELQIVDWGTWLDRVYGQADYDLTVVAQIGRLDPAPILRAYGPDRPDYYFRRGWSSPELDELLRRGIAVADPDERQRIYAAAQYILAAEAVNVFLVAPHQILVQRAGVTGVKILPHYVLDFTAAAKG
ncbi:MAG TPA: ABC transporter substrate-binding protein [Candidatus Bipolaricaulis anaerobius]|nr:ABC transporter substrate-binding protein [Candidatus Bipolaricaulis anaerobius]HNS23653.1 ABC transporter substrate-binding protein [Candidatus Bipolaricaulis anaerobius]